MKQMLNIFERTWHCWLPNAGFAQPTADGVELGVHASSHSYSDGQLDDYGLDRTLRWHAPATLTLEARFNLPFNEFRGTAGFGWWNDPGGTGTRRVRLPRAAWFFAASPPSHLELAPHAPRNGWLAMTLDASTWRMLSLLPFAPLGVLLMQSRWWRRSLLPVIQWMLRVQIRPLAIDWCAWHRYQIEWLTDRVRLTVDDVVVLDSPWSPRGAMGLVLWVDNQYAIVQPNGVLRGGVLAHNTQSLEIRKLE